MSAAQEWVDRVQSTSGQRWLLGIIAVLAPVVACVATGMATDFNPAGMAIVVGLLAVLSSLRPDGYVSVVVIGAVVAFWMSRVDDVTTPWSLVVAFALLTFHTATALMATAPSSAVFDASTVRRWAARSGTVALATVGVWGLVVLLDRGSRAGNSVLSFAAFAAIVAAALFVRARSISREP